MSKLKTLLWVLLALGLVAAPAYAQVGTPLPPVLPAEDQPANPNANISFPPPVYVLRGQFAIRGSANLPNLSNYFIEYRPYSAARLAQETDALWFPVSLPSTQAVVNDVLATWDTTQVPDGIYELRMTMNLISATPVVFYVRPVRVENQPPPFAVTPTPLATPLLIPTLTRPPILPTQPPPPTAIPTQDTTPRVTVTTRAANVRTGDTTFHDIITSFTEGAQFRIVGISARGSGWYLIELPNGQRGWMAPSVVQVSGNLSGLPAVIPPPPPITPTPTTPPPTPTPITSVNLVAGLVELNPATPDCDETFTVGFDVANLGQTQSLSSGIVSLQDFARGQLQEQTIGGFPVLNPGQTFRVNMPITVDTFYDEQHTLVLVIDPQNQVPETNKNDNRRELVYVLDKGDCP
mgnify:CR=1 FL=1